MKSAKHCILIVLGSIALAIGAIGIAVPVLPTTPLVILAALCFASGSPSLYDRLEHNRYFGEYISNYKNGTGVSKKTKIRSIVFLWVMLGISAFFMRHNIPVLAILSVVGICVTLHVILLKGEI